MDYLYEVSSIEETGMAGTINTNQYVLWQPDPFLNLSRFARDTQGSVSHHVRDYQQSTVRTIVKERPSFLDSLGFFVELLTTQAAPRSSVLPGWNPRDRASVTGVQVPDYRFRSFKLSDLFGGVYQLGTRPFKDCRVGWYQKFGEPVPLVFADQMFDLAEQIQAIEGRELSYRFYGPVKNNDGYPSGGFPGVEMRGFRVIIKLTSFDQRAFSYRAHLFSDACDGGYFGGPWGSVLNSQTRYDVRVTRDLKNPWNYSLQTTSGSGSSYFDDNLWQPWGSDWQPTISARTKSFQVLDNKGTVAFTGALATPVSIITSAPALFHTQSGALVSLMSDVSRNFETLVESPELIPMLEAVTTFGWGDELSEKFVSFKSPLARVAFLIKLICGAYLAYIFAISPALKTAQDAIKNFCGTSTKIKGKSFLRFEGDEDDVSGLPPGLRGVLEALWPEEVVHYDCLFGSTLMIGEIPLGKVGNVLESLFLDASRTGVEIDPAYVYAAQPFTFVFDWFIPMGQLIEDAYQRFKLITRRGLTVGHTVALSVTFASGLKIRVFIRSDASLLYLDPPRTTWLQGTGAPSAVAIPLAVVMLL